jgi:hypothetical protein
MLIKTKTKALYLTFITLIFLLVPALSWAVDTEIKINDGEKATPNILFIMDTSGSMRTEVPNTGKTRLRVLQDSLQQIIQNIPGTINVGLMRFSGDNGDFDDDGVYNDSYSPDAFEWVHGPSFPVSSLQDPAQPILVKNILMNVVNDANHRGMFDLTGDNLPDPTSGESVGDYLVRLSNSWNYGGSTPIVDALYEAARYFRGDAVSYGRHAPADKRAAHPSTYNGSLYEELSSSQTCTREICTPESSCDVATKSDPCPTKQVSYTSSTYVDATCVDVTGTIQCQAGETTCGSGQNCVQGETYRQRCWGTNSCGSGQNCTPSPGGTQTCSAGVTSCGSGNNCQLASVTRVECPAGDTTCGSGNNCSLKPTNKVNCPYGVQSCGSGNNCEVYSTSPITCDVDDGSCGVNCTPFQSTTDQTCSTPTCGENCVNNPIDNWTCPDNIYDLENNMCLNPVNNPIDNYTCTSSTTRYQCDFEHYRCDDNPVYECDSVALTECDADPIYHCDSIPLYTCSDNPEYTCKETVKECTHEVCVSSPPAWNLVGSPLYDSPIRERCQSNSIVLLSDGRPDTSHRSDSEKELSRGRVEALIGSSYLPSGSCAPIPGEIPGINTMADGRCGPELARFLATEDQSSVLDDEQTIVTHTIGFGLAGNTLAQDYLRSLATNGRGNYYAVNTASELINAFKSVISATEAVAKTFSAPVYTVDPASFLAHSDEIFIPMFNQKDSPLWEGNLKKFKLLNGKIVDSNNAVAMDSASKLKASATDLWTTTGSISQDVVRSGGMISKLDPANRTLYTDKPNNTLISLDKTESQITLAMLGVSSQTPAYRNALLDFIKGYKADGTSNRHHIGAIVHSKPVLVNYSSSQRLIFFGTNEGYLHAVNAATGEESFAFMPRNLLPDIDIQYRNDASEEHTWGVDGPITVWKHDHNNDGQITTGSSGDFVYVYFGLRRGGRVYYALDVTDPSNPSILWRIDNSSSGFSSLGQTWSKPTLAKLRYKNASNSIVFKEVLVFGGGYDTSVDQETLPRSSISMGNAIYIVDAKTGALVKSFTDSNMASVPGDIRILDIDRNGSLDRLYFADTSGNIWRIDINPMADPSDMYDLSDAKLTRFATLGAPTSGTGDVRKFFYEPDVALFRYRGKFILTIAIGSGYRAHPLNAAISDRFYVLMDENVFDLPPTSFTAITNSDLASISSLNGKALPETNYKGWYLDLPGNDEKVLSPALTFLNKVIFTTFRTRNTLNTLDVCEFQSSNAAKAYVLDLLKGTATVDLNRDGVVDSSDNGVDISYGEIVGAPQVIFKAPAASDGTACTSADDCHQGVDIRIGDKSVAVIDSSNASGSTATGNVDIGSILPKVFWLDHDTE